VNHAPVHIGPMRRRHLRGVVRIEQENSSRPWSLGMFMSELRYRETRRYVVAQRSGLVVGFGGLMLVGDDAHITNIAVDEAHRRSGVASRMLLMLARAAVDEGATQMSLEVRVSNKAAQELYRRFGFVPAGVRKNYYASIAEDALVMWASDINTPAYALRLDAVEATFPADAVMGGVR
jgi:ribosomal-protein-alanine N-acetyltransferase